MAAAWRMLRRYNVGVTRLGVVVLAGYVGAVSVVAYGAYHHEMSLTTLATLLPMLVASAEVGDISWNDVALEWQLTALPNLELLESRLGQSKVGNTTVRDIGQKMSEKFGEEADSLYERIGLFIRRLDESQSLLITGKSNDLRKA